MQYLQRKATQIKKGVDRLETTHRMHATYIWIAQPFIYDGE